MKHIISMWGQELRSEYELEDIEVGVEYACNKHVEPRYLEDDVVKCIAIGKKRITVSDSKYPEEVFHIYPSMLQVKE